MHSSRQYALWERALDRLRRNIFLASEGVKPYDVFLMVGEAHLHFEMAAHVAFSLSANLPIGRQFTREPAVLGVPEVPVGTTPGRPNRRAMVRGSASRA